jgi:hypothetical protein
MHTAQEESRDARRDGRTVPLANGVNGRAVAVRQPGPAQAPAPLTWKQFLQSETAGENHGGRRIDRSQFLAIVFLRSRKQHEASPPP